MTNQAFSAAVTTTICYSLGLTISINSKLSKISALSVTVLAGYGHIQKAAESANRLKMRNHLYYWSLYHEKLEMMYFLIVPLISRNDFFSPLLASDDELAAAITRLIK